MLKDLQYNLYKDFTLSELEHQYGSQVHILKDPFLFSTLARLCSPESKQPLVNELLEVLYNQLVRLVVSQEFPKTKAAITTRMSAAHSEGIFTAPIIDPATQAVCVSLARAGTVPTQICYTALNYILNPEGVRQDHISINRKVDENEKVIGTNLGGVKIGGRIDEAMVLIPDPMGATGSTIKSAFEIYKAHGKAKKIIALHLIVTPEYLSMITKECPEVSIYAIRLDRGLSESEVLNSSLGEFWPKEKGLNQKQYIIPGAGGLGEVINNSYV